MALTAHCQQPSSASGSVRWGGDELKKSKARDISLRPLQHLGQNLCISSSEGRCRKGCATLHNTIYLGVKFFPLKKSTFYLRTALPLPTQISWGPVLQSMV